MIHKNKLKKKIRFNTRIYNSHFKYKLRFIRCSRYQQVFYKLVVVNRYNSILAHLGFYNPFSVNFRVSYSKLEKPLFFTKTVAIDKMQVIYWLQKGAFPTPIVSFMFYQMGLFKTQSNFPVDKHYAYYTAKHYEILKLGNFLNNQLFFFNNVVVSDNSNFF